MEENKVGASIRQIRAAYANLTKSHDELLRLCQQQFPEGSTIFWRTRGYLQIGKVESVYASHPHHGVYIRSENIHTGKMIHVRFYEVDWDVLHDHLSSVEE